MNPIHGLIGRLSSVPALLSPTFNGVPGILRQALAVVDMAAESKKHLQALALSYGGDYGDVDDEEDCPPYVVLGRTAIVPIQGMLINRFTWSCSWATGYDYIIGAVAHAMNNAMVDSIAFDIDSFGGEAQGCFEAGSMLMQMRGKKPMHAFVNANACSAAYAIACVADKITATPTSVTGSIGVVLMHVDYSKMLEENGIAVTYVYAGDHKKDGNSYEPLSPEVKADLQKTVDNFYQMFVASVATARGMTTEAVIATQARCYDAAESLGVGLIDAVEAVPTALAAFINESNGSKSLEISMSTAQEQAAAAAKEAQAVAEAAAQAASTKAVAEAAASERNRISAIVESEEAKDRTTLASHLAFKTNMSVEDAKAMLNASAKEVAAAKTDAGFAAAMEASGNPNISADNQGSADDTPKDESAKILSAYTNATGAKLRQ